MLSVLCQYGTENLKLILYLTICMWKRFFKKGKMLTNVLRVLVKNSFKESFYGKKKINVLTVFFISHKSSVKTFLK